MKAFWRQWANILWIGPMIIGGAPDNDNQTMDPETRNPNHSSYPQSYQGNAVPNEPDLNSGKGAATYRLPSSEPPLAPATSNPNAYPSPASGGGQ